MCVCVLCLFVYGLCLAVLSLGPVRRVVSCGLFSPACLALVCCVRRVGVLCWLWLVSVGLFVLARFGFAWPCLSVRVVFVCAYLFVCVFLCCVWLVVCLFVFVRVRLSAGVFDWLCLHVLAWLCVVCLCVCLCLRVPACLCACLVV